MAALNEGDDEGDDVLMDFEGEPVYDEDAHEVFNEITGPDNGESLVIRKVLTTPLAPYLIRKETKSNMLNLRRSVESLEYLPIRSLLERRVRTF